jgi:hypothetical protein
LTVNPTTLLTSLSLSLQASSEPLSLVELLLAPVLLELDVAELAVLFPPPPHAATANAIASTSPPNRTIRRMLSPLIHALPAWEAWRLYCRLGEWLCPELRIRPRKGCPNV